MNTKTATAISKMWDVSRSVQPPRTAAKAIYSNLPELVKKMFLTVYETTKITYFNTKGHEFVLYSWRYQSIFLYPGSISIVLPGLPILTKKIFDIFGA